MFDFAAALIDLDGTLVDSESLRHVRLLKRSPKPVGTSYLTFTKRSWGWTGTLCETIF